MRQCTDTVLLVRPGRFGANPETASTNVFMTRAVAGDVALLALDEFDRAVDDLTSAGIQVTVLEDTPEPPKPDAVFPNNWFSTHEDGTVVLYPMASPSRSHERRLEDLTTRFDVRTVVDLTPWEREGRCLEGTGSLVLDRSSRIAYAALSPRTCPEVLQDFADKMPYRTVAFPTTYSGAPVYHTNVMLSVGSSFAVVDLHWVSDDGPRRRLEEELRQADRELIELSPGQIAGFAANILQVSRKKGGPAIVCSESSLQTYRPAQRRALERHGELVPLRIGTIEAVGGGSARCMVAEVFLSAKV